MSSASTILSDYLKSLKDAACKDYNREVPFHDLFKITYFSALMWIVGRLLEKRPDILAELEAATATNKKYLEKN